MKYNEHFEKSGKQKILCGWILLFLYCTALLQHIPIVNRFSLFIEIVFILLFIPVLISEFQNLKETKKSLLWIPAGFLLIFLIQTIIWNSLIFPFLSSLTGIGTLTNANQNNLQHMLGQYPALYLTGMVLIGPVLEELLYRFLCFGSIYEKNHFSAHFITALLFGLQHVAEAVFWQGDHKQFINMFSYMIFSLILTFIYSKKKNIWICIGVHILNNLTGVILLLTLSK